MLSKPCESAVKSPSVEHAARTASWRRERSNLRSCSIWTVCCASTRCARSGRRAGVKSMPCEMQYVVVLNRREEPVGCSYFIGEHGRIAVVLRDRCDLRCSAFQSRQLRIVNRRIRYAEQ
jgi:hypothetical protein